MIDLTQGLRTASDVLAALFMVIGGLKVIARYTPFTWDDKVLETIEKPLKAIANLFGKKE